MGSKKMSSILWILVYIFLNGMLLCIASGNVQYYDFVVSSLFPLCIKIIFFSRDIVRSKCLLLFTPHMERWVVITVGVVGM
jgi:hypothetical protein